MTKHKCGMHALIQLKGTDTFLFLKRSEYKKKNALQRDLPGGRLEFGEQTKEAIIRECEEEIGVVCNKDELKTISCLGTRSRRTNKKQINWGTVVFYYIQLESDEIKLSQEHTEYQWLTLADGLKLEPRRKILDEAIALFKEKITSL